MGEAPVIAVLVEPGHHRQRRHFTVFGNLGGGVRSPASSIAAASSRMVGAVNTIRGLTASPRRRALCTNEIATMLSNPRHEEVIIDVRRHAVELLFAHFAQRPLGIGRRRGGIHPR